MSDIKAVRKYAAQHDLFNRLHSIAADESFVRDVAENWFDGRFEVVPNQRCGNWYCDPSTSSKAYAYFKSTDGHMSHWDFNLRRSNLNFAKHAEEKGGLILVDSTRRGKRMPDGLSKTVPIWCCVINLAIELRRNIPLDEEWDTELYLPPKVVPPTEKSQIEEKLDEWAEALERSSLPLPNLSKPLRPFFIHPSTSTPPSIPPNSPYTPIICLSASRWVNGTNDQIPSVTKLGDRTVGFDYVPGGGDDDELWAKGLSPTIFHTNKKELLDAERDDLPSLVDESVISSSIKKLSIPSSSSPHTALATSSSPASSSTLIIGVPSPNLRLGLDIGTPISASTWSYDLNNARVIRVVEVDKHPKEIPRLIKVGEECVLSVVNSKSDGKGYEWTLRELINHIKTTETDGNPIILRSGSSTDYQRSLEVYTSPFTNKEAKLDEPPLPTVETRKLILPLALALLCAIPSLATKRNDVESEFDGQGDKTSRITKNHIADKLHSLVALWPDGNPPRSALKRINDVLMSQERKG
ncbi:uncharacterized protein IL334_003595 [Kwoniella shivajii]|uniref:Initiator tRNA phosphoribosyl transferase n=1 Tax=Kwoniella shivajii TaxID=564305 RepID=A0ABZ1D0Y7_9TREE|nr:hypothetical protein IL334_003595 [Kwoniella shivajii]